MTNAIPASFVVTVFLLVTLGIFVSLLGINRDQANALREANEFRAERIRTLISITATGSSSCSTYTTTADNKSEGISFGDFSDVDVLVRYTNSTGDLVVKRLAHPSQWIVSSISGDNSNPNIWDPGESAILTLTLSPEPKAGTDGTVVVAVPGGISDSAYFSADSSC